jgi:hypothetical protein
MAFRTPLVLAAGIVAGAIGHMALTRAQTRQAVPEAVSAAPGEYTVDMENEYVRVVRVKYPARAKGAMHVHNAPGAAIVTLTDQDARVTGQDGSTRDIHYKAGQVRWAVATPGKDLSTYSAHSEENLRDQPFEILRIEPKITQCR